MTQINTVIDDVVRPSATSRIVQISQKARDRIHRGITDFVSNTILTIDEDLKGGCYDILGDEDRTQRR